MVVSIIKTWRGFIVANGNGRARLYLAAVYDGRAIWTRDYSRARDYARKTAEKHAAAVLAGKLE